MVHFRVFSCDGDVPHTFFEWSPGKRPRRGLFDGLVGVLPIREQYAYQLFTKDVILLRRAPRLITCPRTTGKIPRNHTCNEAHGCKRDQEHSSPRAPNARCSRWVRPLIPRCTPLHCNLGAKGNHPLGPPAGEGPEGPLRGEAPTPGRPPGSKEVLAPHVNPSHRTSPREFPATKHN